jgi:predicted acyl esterase
MNALLPRPVHLAVEVSDGAQLSVLRYPARNGPAPAVVILTPYRKEAAWFNYHHVAIEHGYEVLVADARGFGASTGRYEGPLSEREVEDGVELLEWVAAQDFCTGRTAMIGASYLGALQYRIAARRPRGLCCIAPAIAPLDEYRDMWHRGGIPSFTGWGTDTFFRSQQPATVRDGVSGILRDLMTEFDERQRASSRPQPDLGAIEVPVLCLGGWNDTFTNATVRAFREVRTPKRLVIGEWGHESQPTRTEQSELARWLDFWLRDIGEDPTRAGRNIAVQRIGDGTWHELPNWPAPAEIHHTPWQLVTDDTTLSVVPFLDALPPAPNPLVDPMIDGCIDTGMHLWGESWSADWAAPSGDAAFLGSVGVRLVVTTDRSADFDTHVRLSLVRGDGTVRQLTEGRLRASHRATDFALSQVTGNDDMVVPWHDHTSRTPVVAGKPTTLDIEILPIHVRLGGGERLRLGVSLASVNAAGYGSHAVLHARSRVLLPTYQLT